MKHISVLFYFLGLFLITESLPINAQPSHYKYIYSLKIIPQIPLNSNPIKVACRTTYPTDGGRLDSSNVIINNFEITIIGYHSRNDAAFPSQSNDTITIANLQSGNYNFTYYLEMPNRKTEKDTDYVNFSVGVNAIENQNKLNSIFKIFPNPINSSSMICLPDDKKYSINVYNQVGQRIDHLEFEGKLSYIFKAIYPKGIYTIVATSNNNLYRSKILVELY